MNERNWWRTARRHQSRCAEIKTALERLDESWPMLDAEVTLALKASSPNYLDIIKGGTPVDLVQRYISEVDELRAQEKALKRRMRWHLAKYSTKVPR